MSTELNARHLNIATFAKAALALQGQTPLPALDRLAEEAQADCTGVLVHYAAQGQLRVGADGAESAWLQLSAQTVIPMVCQRCLGMADIAVAFAREYRFVATEAQAEREDETSDEDVLVLSKEFDLLELIEDELLMELPAVPKHAECPQAVKLEVADADFVESSPEKPNPFAVLGALKKKPLS